MYKIQTIAILVITLFSFSVTGKPVKIMSYNIENLFDTVHDIGKHDYSYLPYFVKRNSQEVQTFCKDLGNPYYRGICFNLDWNKSVLKAKILNLAKIIKVEKPDILIVQEIENINALNLLNTIGLKGQGYKYSILLEGQDIRGIDIGILSKYPLARPAQLHHVNTPSINNNGVPDKETRGILEASFKINGKILTIFGNHWPSQSHPDESRVLAGKTLYKAINSKDDLVIALGDFNTAENDELSGIDQYLLNTRRSKTFIDAETQFFKLNPNSTAQRGTHKYKGRWGSLDHIFVLNQTKKITPRWNSFQVVAHDFMFTINSRNKKVPFRFDPKLKQGFTDHLPVTISLDF